jgi:hypothetical protein
MGQDPYFLEEFFVHEAIKYQIIRYSTYGRDKLPTSQEEFIIHETTTIDYIGARPSDGTRSLDPKRISSSMRRIIRLLRYSIPGWDKFPTSKDLAIQEMTIHQLLRTRLREHRKEENNRLLQYSKQSLRFLQRNYSSTRRQPNQLLRYPKMQSRRQAS